MENGDKQKLLLLKKAFAKTFKKLSATKGYKTFIEKNADWLLPYAAFCVLRDQFGTPDFSQWHGYAKYDAVLAMYHDQGLTPFKTLSPDGVNFTAGLSVVRTSPDHGTAYDIAGKGIADPQSMRNAIYAAIDIVRNREEWAEWSANPLQRFERDKGRDVSIKDLKLPEQEEDQRRRIQNSKFKIQNLELRVKV